MSINVTDKEKAIDYLKESVLIYKNTIPKISEAIETVLSMLKEKDKEIEKLKKENELAKEQLKKQCEVADERNDLLVKVQELQKENEEKDKQIDLIIEEYEYNDRINFKNFCEDELRKDSCIQDCKLCAKHYFEKLAKEDK